MCAIDFVVYEEIVRLPGLPDIWIDIIYYEYQFRQMLHFFLFSHVSTYTGIAQNGS